MAESTFDKKTYCCHQCDDGYCELSVFSSEKFDVLPKDCMYKSIQKSLNIDIKPVWVKV